MPDLLFEIGTEELPSWYIDQGRFALARLLQERLEQAQLPPESVAAYGTPRRLAVWARGLPAASPRREELRRGPAAAVALDAAGTLTRAATGFAASNGVPSEALEVRDTDKGRYLFARLERGGEDAAELLPPLLARLVVDLPAPRKMRWADVTTPFLRPVQWLLALLDEQALELEAAGVRSGGHSFGHRFLSPGAVPIARPSAYLAAMRDAWVLADADERDVTTRSAVKEAAAANGLRVDDDGALPAEVRNLVEYPFAIDGAFDQSYLGLPEEVLSTVMIHHQRFFPTRGEDGRLAARFVAVSNNRVTDPAVVRAGYERVLGGRLYDARFFWDADRRKSLSQHAWGLSGIAFQKDLGSMADKVARVGDVARALAAGLELGPAEQATLAQALPIFHADLSTDMVFELPELAGVMARAYALEEGLPPATATALEDGVLPRGPTDRLPSTRVGAVLSVADRLDKIMGFFALGKRPSGSADPFALRRDGLGLVRVLNAQGWRMPLTALAAAAATRHRASGLEVPAAIETEMVQFLWDRVASLLGEQRLAVAVIRASVTGSETVIDAARRAYLLRALMAREELASLLALYKRAANLAGKATGEPGAVRPTAFRDKHEAPLYEALPVARRGVEALLSAAKRALVPWDLAQPPSGTLPDLDAAVAQVLTLRAPLDAFLDHVLVMVDEPDVRANRLALLREVTAALRGLGALDQLEGT